MKVLVTLAALLHLKPEEAMVSIVGMNASGDNLLTDEMAAAGARFEDNEKLKQDGQQ